jgi:hypothetical protein
VRIAVARRLVSQQAAQAEAQEALSCLSRYAGGAQLMRAKVRPTPEGGRVAGILPRGDARAGQTPRAYLRRAAIDLALIPIATAVLYGLDFRGVILLVPLIVQIPLAGFGLWKARKLQSAAESRAA